MTDSGPDVSANGHHVSANGVPTPAAAAVADAEHDRGIESLVAEVHVEHESLALTSTLAAVPSASVVIDSHVSGARESAVWFLSVTAERFEAFDDALAADDTVAEFTPLGTFDARRVYRVRLSSDALILRRVMAEMGIRIVEKRSHGEGWLLRLQLGDRSPLLTFREHCSAHDIHFSLRALTFASDADPRATSLTAAQRETLLTAYEMGYYDLPRRSSQEELADALDVSASAISQRLRRAVGALIEGTIADGVQR